ncbi:MAG: hypothetical protein JSR82_17365 [Verrucomicrobia bacterium]|nr:hypothetical protein [Verrucomicrobiota bacterium]
MSLRLPPTLRSVALALGVLLLTALLYAPPAAPAEPAKSARSSSRP